MSLSYYSRSEGKKVGLQEIWSKAIDYNNRADIFGKKDVIDVILLSSMPDAMSVSPLQFANEIASKIGTSNNSKRIDNNLWCLSDQKAPIDTYKFDRSSVTKLNPQIQKGTNSWGEDDSNKRQRINGRSGIFIQNQIDIQGANGKGGKSAYIYPDDSKCTCTEFSILYGDANPINELMFYGYELANPGTFTARTNWLRYASDSNDHDSHLMIFLLTAPRLLQELRFTATKSDDLNTLKQRSTSSDVVKRIVGKYCSATPNEMPDTAIFTPNTYYMGDAIYSANGKYKFLIQPDGNIVIYNLENRSAGWNTGTNGTTYYRPRVVIKDNGRFSIQNQDGGNEKVIADINNGNGAYLGISNTGDLVLRDKQNHVVLWISRSVPLDKNNRLVYTNYFANSAFYFDYKTSYKTGSAIYSPNLLYKLIFQPDGNLVLYETLSGNPKWASGTNNKGGTALSIQEDGNVVIYNDAKQAIWAAGTFDWKTKVNLVVDNTGIILLLAYPDGQPVYAWGGPGEFNWVNLYAGSGALLNQRAAYLIDKGGNPVFNSLDKPTMDSDLCIAGDYKDAYDKTAQLQARADYCKQGYNLLLDQATCGIFGSNLKPEGDGGDSPIKREVDRYVKDIICAKGYDQKFSENKPVQQLLNDFCSCVAPVGTMQEIQNSSVDPTCYDNACRNNGYKSYQNLNPPQPCPTCLCSNVIDGTNSKFNNVEMTCAPGCTELGNAKTASTSNTTTTTNTTNTGSAATGPTTTNIKTTTTTNTTNSPATTNGNTSTTLDTTLKIPDNIIDDTPPQSTTSADTIIWIIAAICIVLLLGMMGFAIYKAMKSKSTRRDQPPIYGPMNQPDQPPIYGPMNQPDQPEMYSQEYR